MQTLPLPETSSRALGAGPGHPRAGDDASARVAPPGFETRLRRGRGPRGLTAWLTSPDAPRPGARPLVAVHGISRGAEAQARAFAARAAAQGRTVVAPLFDEARWNGYQRAAAPRRADLALLGLLEELALEGSLPDGPFDLFGYSGGAQFAHRFAMLYPHRLRRLSVCAAGWWTAPDPSAPFPHGLGGAWGARMAAGLDRFLGLEITVAVGACDDRPDPALRRDPALDARQGTHRVARARAYAAALRAEAARRGLPDRVRFATLPGCGHDFDACAAGGALIDLVLPNACEGADR